jgi:hypothetical protein
MTQLELPFPGKETDTPITSHDQALERLDWIINYLQSKQHRVISLKHHSEWNPDEITFLFMELEAVRSSLLAQGDIP